MASNYGTFVGHIKKPTGANAPEYVAPAKKNENVLLLNGSFEADTSKVFVKMVGFKQDKIRVSLGGGEKMEVAWADRFDEKILEKVPNWAKTTIKIGDERKEFLSTWDAIEYLNDNFDKYENTRVQTSIKWDKNIYNGIANDQYTIQSIYPAKEDAKDSLNVKTIFWWNKDSIDNADWDSDKILRVNGYIKSYDRDEKKDLFFPQTIVLNCSKIDFDDEHQKALADYRINKLKTSSTTYQECRLDCALLVGAEKKDDDDWDESMLTDAQKEQVELGLKTANDFRPGGTVYGEFKTELRLKDFDFNGDYADGIVDSGLTQEQLEEDMWNGAKIDSPDDFVDIEGAAKDSIDALFV